MKSVLCVILHYGNVDDTFNCIKSLLNDETVEIVVCDNDPQQNFKLDKSFSGIQIYKSGGSMGFAEANNATVRTFLKSQHEFIFILNNDTLILNNAVSLLKTSLGNNKVGLVGPCMYYSSDLKDIWACGGWVNFITLRIGGFNKLKSNKPFEVDYLPGAAIMVRKNIWIQLKGLPEKYFLAYEEAEFALNIKKKGLMILAIPEAKIVHLVGMSNQVKPMYLYNGNRNRILFGKYLYGEFFGFILGTINILVDSFKTFNVIRLLMNINLFYLSLLHELRNVPLDKKLLTFINNKFN
jgi:GT2 family glycosyltransferase